MYNGKITYEVTILYEISKEKTSEKVLSLLKELNNFKYATSISLIIQMET